MPTKTPEAARHRVAIAAALRAVRDRQGMTQGELAHAAGLQQQLVSRYESDLGGIEPSCSTIYALEAALGVIHGSVLREAGMVDDPAMSIEGVLDLDPLITADMRATVLSVYEIARRHTGARKTRAALKGQKAASQ